MINKVILVGNLGAKPELKTTNSGMSVSSMRLATSDRKKDGATGDWVDITEWHTVTVFGSTADNCCKFLDKGRQIYVEGRLQTRKWEDKEGQPKLLPTRSSSSVLKMVLHLERTTRTFHFEFKTLP